MTETDSPYPQAVRELFSAFLFPCHFERSEKSVSSVDVFRCFTPFSMTVG